MFSRVIDKNLRRFNEEGKPGEWQHFTTAELREAELLQRNPEYQASLVKLHPQMKLNLWQRLKRWVRRKIA